MLRKPVGNFVIVTFFADEDMHFNCGASWTVKRPHRDCNPVTMRRLPKKRGAALATKATADLLRGLEPFERVSTQIAFYIYRSGKFPAAVDQLLR